MAEFEKRLPMWNAPGIEPPLSKTDEGWKKSERPPAEYMNFLQYTTFEALKELQENAGHKVEIEKVSNQVEILQSVAINVMGKGASLDGVTDDTHALIAAHDALPDTGGKIQVPAIGKLTINAPVTFTKTVILEGTSVNQLTSNTGSVILTKGSGELILKGDCSGIRDILIDGTPDNTKNGITMLCARPWLVNVTAVNQGKHGVQIGSDTELSNVNDWYINNLRAKSNKLDGLYIAHPDINHPNANAGTLIKIDSSYNYRNGITAKNCFDNQYIGVHCEGNSGYGIQLINSGSNAFFKPYLEANLLGDIKGDIDSKYNYVYGLRRDENILSVKFENEENFVMGRSTSKSLFPVSTRQGTELLMISKEGISGYWSAKQDDINRDLKFILQGTAADAKITFEHGTGGKVTLSPPEFQIGGGQVITKHMVSPATLNFGTIPANSHSDKTIKVIGAKLADSVFASPNGLPESGVVWSACVSADDTITVRVANVTTSPITMTQRSWRADVWQH